nr:hypothetical protein [Tanacetum cinerariifolium]
WKSRIKRYIDTKPNKELIHYYLQNPPYKFKWTEKTAPVAEGSLETTIEWYIENYKNVSQDIRDQLDAEAEVVQIILTWIDNDIYSTVDAYTNACKIWKAISRWKQGESVNVQDLKTNLYWEFGKFTSRDVLTSITTRMAKIRAKRITRTANPLALVAQQQPVYHPHNHPTHYTQNSLTKSQQATTRNRGKVIVNSFSPTYDQETIMVIEDDEMSKDKEIDKIMALISLSFKKIYKPANNNLRTSSNTSRANQDNTPRVNRETRYDNQKIANVDGARENVGTKVVQQSRIQCYNCKEYRHVARECQKPKRAKDAAYHKEKMLMCKKEEAGVQLNAKQADWKDDTDDESDDQELEAYYMYMAQIQESQELKTVSYHKLYDILKQHQNEVNEIRAERLARTVNPLTLVAQQQPVYHPQKHPTHYTQNYSTRSQQVATRNRGKAIVNSPPPIYDQELTMVAEDDEMSKGTPMVHQSGIQCYNCKEYGHVARECHNPKRAKDAAYHKEKMLLCKHEEVGFQLNAKQADWRDDTDDEPDDQEMEAHYMYMAQIQEVTPDAADNSGPIFDSEPLQKVDQDDDNDLANE